MSEIDSWRNKHQSDSVKVYYLGLSAACKVYITSHYVCHTIEKEWLRKIQTIVNNT